MFTKKKIRQVLNAHWDDIARFAYDGFLDRGKGVVRLHLEADGQIRMRYIADEGKDVKVDPRAQRLVREYDPDQEMLVEYTGEDHTNRTIRAVTAEGIRHTWGIRKLQQMMWKGNLTEEDMLRELGAGQGTDQR